MSPIPFQTIDWASILKTEHPGDTGMAYWQMLQFGELRIRIVEYTAGYLAKLPSVSDGEGGEIVDCGWRIFVCLVNKKAANAN
jgi:hypothetical protein